MGIKRVADLFGKDLSGFKVKEMFEVVEFGGDGQAENSLGFLENGEIADGFVACQTNPQHFRTVSRSILTDGKVGFILKVDPVGFIDEGGAKQAIIEKGLAMLSGIQRKLITSA
jgi:hypothetical protein